MRQRMPKSSQDNNSCMKLWGRVDPGPGTGRGWTKITQQSMTSKRNVAHPGCLFATFPASDPSILFLSLLDSWTTSKMLHLFNGHNILETSTRSSWDIPGYPGYSTISATRSLVQRDNKMKTLNVQVKEWRKIVDTERKSTLYYKVSKKVRKKLQEDEVTSRIDLKSFPFF